MEDDGDKIDFEMKSKDGEVTVQVRGCTANLMSHISSFREVADASAFFERGSIGYSATSDANRLDGIQLRTKTWKVAPLRVEHAYSSFFADEKKFPKDTAAFDCALISAGHRTRLERGSRTAFLNRAMSQDFCHRIANGKQLSASVPCTLEQFLVAQKLPCRAAWWWNITARPWLSEFPQSHGCGRRPVGDREDQTVGGGISRPTNKLHPIPLFVGDFRRFDTENQVSLREEKPIMAFGRE